LGPADLWNPEHASSTTTRWLRAASAELTDGRYRGVIGFRKARSAAHIDQIAYDALAHSEQLKGHQQDINRRLAPAPRE
jgi:hypothetical protein